MLPAQHQTQNNLHSGMLNGELWELKNGGDIKKLVFASDLKQTAEWSSNKNGLLNIAGMVERRRTRSLIFQIGL
jgi:hypothetical protein